MQVASQGESRPEHARVADRAREGLDRDVGHAEENARRGAEQHAVVLVVDAELGREHQQDADRQQAGLEGDHARERVARVRAVAVGQRDGQQHQPEGGEADAQPLAGAALAAEPALGHDGEKNEPAGDDRRYSPRACDRVLEAAGLTIVERGGVFHSLVIPRAVTVLRERIAPAVGRGDPPTLESSAATWRGGRIVTSLTLGALRIDNAVSRLASRAGVNVPGLSYWALARRLH